MRTPARQQLLGGCARLSLLVLLTVGTILALGQRQVSSEVVATLPWFCVAFICYLAPLFVSPTTDLFSPPGLIALRNGFNMAAIMAAVSVADGVRIPVLRHLMEDQRIELARQVALLHIVAQLSYLLGYYGSSGERISGLFPKVSERIWNGKRLLIAIVVTSLIAGAFYAIFQSLHGGSLFDVTNLARGKQVLRFDDSLSWLSRGVMFLFVPVLLLFCLAIANRSRWLLAFSAICFVVAALLVTRTGVRGMAAIAGLMVLILFHFLWRRIRLSMAIALLLGAVVVGNILGEYRSGTRQETTFVEGMSDPISSMAEHEDDRNRLSALAVIMHYFPERQDYLMGKTYSKLPLIWIPNWIWLEKKRHFSWSDTAILRRLVGLPAPTPYQGVLYANFAWVGVVIGMALFGAFHRGLYRYRERSPLDLGTALIYVSVLGSFTPTLLGISTSAQFAIPLVLLIYLVSVRRRPPAPDDCRPDIEVHHGPSAVVPLRP